jgi:hypothetical protein
LPDSGARIGYEEKHFSEGDPFTKSDMHHALDEFKASFQQSPVVTLDLRMPRDYMGLAVGHLMAMTVLRSTIGRCKRGQQKTKVLQRKGLASRAKE